ncbi:MAG TPA: Ig-like domain-containing protein [Pyrinomonadaceae bacterium]|nr:Ig-like domain-containing protein [Pyrinomonadaceae bacterium]
MYKLLSSLVMVLFLSSGVLAQEWAWKYFSPAGKPWSVLAPGEMQPDEEAQQSRSKMGSYSYSDFYGYFAVVYRDAPKTFLISLKPDAKAHFKKVKNDFITASRGQLLKEEDFESGKAKGRELLIKIPSGTITGLEGQVITKYRIERLRMFFIGRRFFMLLAVLPEDIVNTPQVDKFFNSFSTNTAPQAVADSYVTDEDTVLNISNGRGVLANDTDEEDDNLSVANAKPQTLPTHGRLSLNADGSFNYTPEANFNGTDSFTYKANDGQADSAETTVIIKINSVNDAPTIADLPPSSTLDELTPLSFSASANDIDTPASALRFSLSEAPTGAAIDPVSGAFRWTPSEAQGPANYTFRVNVSDGSATASQTINVAVKEVNVAPQLSNVPPSATINELSAYTFAPTATDADIPNQPLTFSLINAPAGATINPSNGAFSWTPSEAQGNGSAYNFTVRVSDGLASTDVPVKLTAQEVNSAPALAGISAQTVDELKPLSLTANGSDTDDPVNALTYSLGEGAPSGMTIDSKTGAISWTPSEAQGAGDFPVTVRVTDNGSPSLSATRTFNVRVNEINAAPKLTAIGNKTVDEETLLTFTAGANDSDLPANSLTYSLVNAPAGAAINASTGAFSWTPTEAQGAGSYTVTFRVTDNGTPALSAEETVTITVREVNQPPVVNNAEINGVEDKSVSFVLNASDVDLPANTLKYSIVAGPQNGSLSGSGLNLTYTPKPDFNGSDSFKYKVNDGAADSAAATISIKIAPVNDAPTANPDRAETKENVPVDISVTANDKDVDGDKITVTGVSDAVGGTVKIGSGGNVQFTPNQDFRGTGSFKYTISDGSGGTAIGLVTVTVNPAENK